MAECKEHMEMNVDLENNNEKMDRESLIGDSGKTMQVRMKAQLSGLTGCKLHTPLLHKQNEEVEINAPIILSKDTVLYKQDKSENDQFEIVAKKEKCCLPECCIKFAFPDSEFIKKILHIQDEESAIINIPILQNETKPIKREGVTRIAKDKGTVILFENSHFQLSGNVSDLVRLTPEKLAHILRELRERSDPRSKIWLVCSGVGILKVAVEREDSPHKDLSSYKLVVESMKIHRNTGSETSGSENITTSMPSFSPELIPNDKTKKFENARRLMRQKFQVLQAIKMSQKRENSTSWFDKIMLMMKFVLVVIWGLALFLFFMLMIRWICYAVQTKEAISKSEAILSKAEVLLNKFDKKVLACIPDDHLKSFDASSKIPPIFFIPKALSVKMETLHSLCSKNFKLILYSNDELSYNFTVVDSASLFPPTAQLVPAEDSSFNFCNDGFYIVLLMIIVASLVFYLVEIIACFCRGRFKKSTIMEHQKIQV